MVVRVLGSLLLVACESGTARQVQIDVGPAVTSQFDASSPGVLVTDVAGPPAPVAALCGQPEPAPLELWVDDGFGCLRERAEAGQTQLVQAWVEPTPALADDPCTLARDLRGALPLDSKDRSVLASAPDPSWPAGSATGVWRRDLSPCGGVLRVTGLTVD